MRTEIRNLAENGDESAMRALIALARAGELNDRDIADLARALAQSGSHFDTQPHSADLASTGGPSSLSTLICPLHLRARGLTVPKLGVRGRPAGGVDVLETIPGFRSTLDLGASKTALKRSGYVHLLADDRWAPLDARLFAYRQLDHAQALPALATASILAKKLAAGVEGVGLEIRVAPHGNFGEDFADARRNAQQYNTVAALLGLRPVCALTDASRPYQPYIGRGEALAALASVLEDEPCDWLAEHHSLCIRISDAVASTLGVDVTRPVELATMRRVHEAMLLAQGVNPAVFWRRSKEIRDTPRRTVSVDRSGWIEYDLGRLRALLVERQHSVDSPRRGSPPDSVGVVLLARPGDYVEPKQPIIAVRDPEGQEEFLCRIEACVCISVSEVQRPRSAPTEIVTPQ